MAAVESSNAVLLTWSSNVEEVECPVLFATLAFGSWQDILMRGHAEML